MQLTQRITGVTLFLFALLALSGFVATAHADEWQQNSDHGSYQNQNRGDTDWNNDSSCEVRYDSWQNGTNGNWTNDGWKWDDAHGVWKKCDANEDNEHNWKDDDRNGQNDWYRDNSGNWKDRCNDWQDDNHDNRQDSSGKDWDDWNNGRNSGWNDDRNNDSDWGKDGRDGNDGRGKDGEDGKDGKDGNNRNDWNNDNGNQRSGGLRVSTHLGLHL